MARSAIAWSSGTRTLEYSGSTASAQKHKGKQPKCLQNCKFIPWVSLIFVHLKSTYWNPRWTDPVFRQRQCSPQSPIKHEWRNESSIYSIYSYFYSYFNVTHSVHPLPIERHHCVGCVTHKDTFVANVIWGALDRHHGLCGQSEIIPLESITERHKLK